MMIQSMHHSANDDAQLDNPDHMLHSYITLSLSYVFSNDMLLNVLFVFVLDQHRQFIQFLTLFFCDDDEVSTESQKLIGILCRTQQFYLSLLCLQSQIAIHIIISAIKPPPNKHMTSSPIATQKQPPTLPPITRNDLQFYPQYNLSSQLLKHQLQMLQFLYYTEYDIIYETFQLKHAAYLQKKRGEVVRRFKSEQIARHFQIASQRMHIRILRDDIDLDKLLSRLEMTWHNKNIPQFHRYYFLKYIFTTYFKNLEQLILNQEKLIRDDQHIYYSIFRAINARQSCLRQVRKFLSELNIEDVYEYLHVAKQRLYNQRRKAQQQKYKIQGYKIKMVLDDNKHGKLSKTKFQDFSDLFNHLTKLTLYVIELITKWKEYIYSLTHDQRKKKERVQYYYYDDNYFLKILSDIGFLRVSFLSNFYDFAPKNDPFLFKCILAFEKREEKTLQNQLLKQIFMPQPEHLTDIMSKLEQLSEEYKHNIRSRKVYDLNALKKPIQISQQKALRNSVVRQPISNLFLKKVDSPQKNQSPNLPKKSQSQKNFRVRDTSGVKKQNEKIIVDFKASPNNTRKKRNISMPGAQQKLVYEQETSPLKHSIILQKNVSDPNIQKLIDAKLLGMLKDEVIKKVKAEFQLQSKKQLNKNQALQLYIDNKVKQAMKQVFPYQPQKQLKLPIQFTTRSIPEQQTSSQIVKMYKKSIFRFADMQMKEVELIKKIESCEFVYFVRATIGEEIIGDIVCTLDRQIKEYKALKILYIGFYDFSQLEMLMLRFVEFLWKYQNAFQVIYSFLQPANNEPIEQLIRVLQKNLEHNCIPVVKQIYSNISQVRFIFKRKSKNVNYIPNLQPVGLKLTFAALLSDKKLMLENSSFKKKSQPICYDFFIMEILRKYVASDQFIILKQQIKWVDRLKIILEMILAADKQKDMGVKIKLTEAENVSDLNKMLSKNHQLMLEVSDLVKTNLLKLMRIDLSLTLPFQVKSVYQKSASHTQYFRYTIHNKLQYWSTSSTNFYFFPTNQHKNMTVVFFSAREFIDQSSAAQGKVYLSVYLKKAIASSQLQVRQVEKLWVPMFRYPEKYQQRQDIYLPTFRVQDLFPIKKDLLIGQQLQYFCNMEMQNGVHYEKTKADLIIEKPFGIALLAGEDRNVIYSRIVNL